MKNSYTEQEALDEIFNSKSLSAHMRTLKVRFKKGTLTHETKQQILKNHNFIIDKETIYKKN
jgi:hypothetical protein